MNARQKAKFYKKLYEKERACTPPTYHIDKYERYNLNRIVRNDIPIEVQANEVELMVEEFMSNMKDLAFSHIKHRESEMHNYTHYWIDVLFRK